jgi:hypothetical protein
MKKILATLYLLLLIHIPLHGMMKKFRNMGKPPKKTKTSKSTSSTLSMGKPPKFFEKNKKFKVDDESLHSIYSDLTSDNKSKAYLLEAINEGWLNADSSCED